MQQINIQNNNKRIMLTGGGTSGSVTPLLSLKEEFEKNNYELLWVGTRNGIEQKMIDKEDIIFKGIFSGKLRRYFSWQNFLDPFFIFFGFLQALYIILKWKPNIVMSAGGFVSVPIIWAAWLCRVPSLIHQQDARAGLSNKLMAPFAHTITTTFEKSLKDYNQKAIWIGNETQCSIIKKQSSRKSIYEYFELKKDLPVIFIIGGMTGAMGINKIVWDILPDLNKFCQIIHITGESKIRNQKSKIKNYIQYELMNKEQLAMAYAIADIVVSRCGMGTLTELSHLAKPSILIPMPGTHQEDNAQIFIDNKAAIILSQQELMQDSQLLTQNIKNLLNSAKIKNKLSKNIKEVIKQEYNQKIIKIIKEIFK